MVLKEVHKRRSRVGRTQQKVLLMLMAGLALGLSSRPDKYFQILKAFKKDWEILDNPQFSRSLQSLADQKFVTCEQNHYGTLRVRLTDKGKTYALICGDSALAPSGSKDKWDGVWHVVIFDIPTNKIRYAIRSGDT